MLRRGNQGQKGNFSGENRVIAFRENCELTLKAEVTKDKQTGYDFHLEK
jgi:hypothetical protein